MENIGHHDITGFYHPAVSVRNRKAAWHSFQRRIYRTVIARNISFRVEICKDKNQLDLWVLYFLFSQNCRSQTVKGSVSTKIKYVYALLN